MRMSLVAVGSATQRTINGRSSKPLLVAAFGLAAAALSAGSAGAAVFSFDNGAPDGKTGALAQPASTGRIPIEVSDDFNLASQTQLNHATFTGLLGGGA
jgi:hypothetical protein